MYIFRFLRFLGTKKDLVFRKADVCLWSMLNFFLSLWSTFIFFRVFSRFEIINGGTIRHARTHTHARMHTHSLSPSLSLFKELNVERVLFKFSLNLVLCGGEAPLGSSQSSILTPFPSLATTCLPDSYRGHRVLCPAISATPKVEFDGVCCTLAFGKSFSLAQEFFSPHFGRLLQLFVAFVAKYLWSGCGLFWHLPNCGSQERHKTVSAVGGTRKQRPKYITSSCCTITLHTKEEGGKVVWCFPAVNFRRAESDKSNSLSGPLFSW